MMSPNSGGRLVRLFTSFSCCALCVLLSIDLLSFLISGDTFGEAAVYTMTVGLKGFNHKNAWTHLLLGSALLLVSLAVLVSCHKLPCIARKSRCFLLGLNLATISLCACTSVSKYMFVTSYHDAFSEQTGFANHYFRFPGKIRPERNLLFLYLESIEYAFFDESIFPGLLPNLKRLGRRMDNYTHIEMEGGWTIAALTSSLCGIRLVTPSGGENQMNRAGSFLPRARCLGDVLHDAGYALHYLGGAPKEFSGKDKFFTSHGFQKVEGKAEGLVQGEPKAPWGRFDEYLLDDVFLRYQQLANHSQPFGLFTETVDTHAPGGVVSPKCKDHIYGDGTNGMLNSVHCTDLVIGEFLDKLMAQKAFKNTVLVIFSDHLAMANSADHLLKKVPNRRLTLLIMDGHRSPEIANVVEIPRVASTLDICPTVLSYLTNVAQLKFGLGRSLRDESSMTLVEEMGVSSFYNQLGAWRSTFMSFWDFPKSVSAGFKMTGNTTIDISGSKFDLPVAFQLQDEIIEQIFLSAKAASKTMHDSNKTVLFIGPCRKMMGFETACEYPCYLYRKDTACFIGRFPNKHTVYLSAFEESEKRSSPQSSLCVPL